MIMQVANRRQLTIFERIKRWLGISR